jgi:hypothetical protein
MTTTSTPDTKKAPTYLKKYNEKLGTPPGPFMGLWSMAYMDRLKAARLVLFRSLNMVSPKRIGRHAEWYATFLGKQRPGTPFQHLDLETTTGERINTADFVGKKNVVIMVGAIT